MQEWASLSRLVTLNSSAKSIGAMSQFIIVSYTEL
jgi:hypothetical protein